MRLVTPQGYFMRYISHFLSEQYKIIFILFREAIHKGRSMSKRPPCCSTWTVCQLVDLYYEVMFAAAVCISVAW